MKPDIWMHFTKRPHGEEGYKSKGFICYRLFAFLVDATDENWDILNAKDGSAVDNSFAHDCHDGSHSGAHIAGNKNKGCVNGILHGKFSTPLKTAFNQNCHAKDRSQRLWHCDRF